MANRQPKLKRTLSFPAMVFYGLGTIVGAGIYVRIGKIAGQAGPWTPAAFAPRSRQSSRSLRHLVAARLPPRAAIAKLKGRLVELSKVAGNWHAKAQAQSARQWRG